MKKINLVCVLAAALVLFVGGIYVVYGWLHEDTTPPVFTMESDVIECSIHATQKELTAGLSAADDVDGDLTDHIMVNDIQIKKDENSSGNEFEITYVVFDSSNNVTFASRRLIYKDYHSPRFVIADALRFTSASAVNLYNQLIVYDCIDGDISSQITVEMGDAYTEETISYGVYDCTLQVTNSLGDTSVLPVSFEVYDANSESTASRVLLNQYLVYVEKGKAFHPEDFLKGVVVDRVGYWLVDEDQLLEESTVEFGYGYTNDNYDYFMMKDTVDIVSSVNVKKPGLYTVTYSYQHPKTGEWTSAELMVVVED